MPPTATLLIAFAVMGAAAVVARRLLLRSAERRLREPISLALDFLIGQCEDPRDPLADISATETSTPRRKITRYFVYPTKRHFFSFTRVTEEGGTTYRLDRWSRDVLAEEFPPWFIAPIPCRSPWFVDRMKRLTDLVDAYPRERLLSERAHRAMRAVGVEPPKP